MQGRCSGQLDDIPVIVSRLDSCTTDIYVWCGAKRLQLCGSVLHLSCDSCHQRPVLSTSTSDRCMRPGTVVRRQAVDALARLMCGADVLLSSDSSATLQRGLLWHWSCRIWTTVTPCWVVFQHPHWHRFSKSSMSWHVLFWISSHATM